MTESPPPARDTVWAIVVAAGVGSRFGAVKQFEPLGDRRVVDWAVEAALAVAAGVVLVVPPDRHRGPEPAVDAVVPGGATRSMSVRAGLAAVPPEADIVVIHDAARPLAPVRLFEAVIDAVRAGADAAVPALPVADTVKRVEAGWVLATVERDGLVAVQTPQAFRAACLRAAHGRKPEATDDAGLVEACGGRVAVVEGDPRNRKLTTRDDLLAARSLIEDQP